MILVFLFCCSDSCILGQISSIAKQVCCSEKGANLISESSIVNTLMKIYRQRQEGKLDCEELNLFECEREYCTLMYGEHQDNILLANFIHSSSRQGTLRLLF